MSNLLHYLTITQTRWKCRHYLLPKWFVAIKIPPQSPFLFSFYWIFQSYFRWVFFVVSGSCVCSILTDITLHFLKVQSNWSKSILANVFSVSQQGKTLTFSRLLQTLVRNERLSVLDKYGRWDANNERLARQSENEATSFVSVRNCHKRSDTWSGRQQASVWLACVFAVCPVAASRSAALAPAFFPLFVLSSLVQP